MAFQLLRIGDLIIAGVPGAAGKLIFCVSTKQVNNLKCVLPFLRGLLSSLAGGLPPLPRVTSGKPMLAAHLR